MLGYLVARRLTAPPHPRRHPLTVRSSTPTTVTLDATPTTTVAGDWGLFVAGGGHARVHGLPRIDAGRATWDLAPGSSPPPPGSRVSWTGIVDPSPPAGTRTHRLPAGDAWQVGDVADAPLVAVHLHGLGSTRAGTLRGVAAATAAGLPSLVPAYRNTLDGRRLGRGRSHLGLTETDDLVDALRLLDDVGARRFVLFGWSMGAQLCLRLAADGAWAARIDRMVLDSPVLDWRAVLAANVTAAHLPRAAATSAARWLRHPRALGLDAPVDLDAADFVARASEVRHPVLVHHGTRDWSVPLASSRRFVEGAPAGELVTSGGGHTTGWNVDAASWHAATARFLAAHSL